MVLENTVEFKEITDKNVFAVVDDETKRTLAEITGYDIKVKYNLEEINSQEDIEVVSNGIAEIFKEMLINNLLKRG